MSTELRPTIRGRDSELAVLDHQLERLRLGSGMVVLVEGAPGIGKSRLIDEAAEMARRRSWPVGIGVAETAENVAELAPLLRALFDGRDALLDRSLGVGLRGAPEQRYWMLQDLQFLLERAATAGPLLICLDDLQWADAGTLAALRTLPARLASMPIGWVLAMRPGSGQVQLSRSVDPLLQDGAVRLVLEELDRPTVAHVAADAFHSEPDSALLRLAEEAAGNPFLLRELLLGLEEEQLVRIESGRARLAQARIPARVGRSMQERLSLMPEPAGQLAAVAASLGRTFSFSDLGTMLDLTPAALLTPVEQLVDAGILREHEDGLSFQHDLTREAVRRASPVSARRALDRQGATVLLAGGALPVEVAAQLAASADQGDEVAVTMLAEAAQALGDSDPGTAADLSRRALELAPPGAPVRGALVAQTILLLHAAARPDEAKTFADQHLANVLTSAAEAEVCLSIASMFALSPDVRAAANRRALDLADLSPHHRARHVAGLAYNLVQAGRRGQARSLLAGARTSVTSAEDMTATSVLRVTEAALLYGDGNFDHSLKMHEDVMRGGFGPGGTTRERVAYQWRCELLSVVDRLDDSLRLISVGIAGASLDRQRWALDFFETWRGRQLFQRGRLSDAAAALEGRFVPAEAHSVVGALYAAGVVALGRTAIHTGDERGKRDTAVIARVMLDTGTPANRRHGAWLLALLAMADSDPSTARGWIAAADSSGAMSILPLHPMDVTDEPHLVRLALACGDRRLAVEAVESAARRAGYNPTVACVNATVAHARGLLEDDVNQLSTAARLLDGGQRPLALASALEDLGGARLRDGSVEGGIEAIGQALVLYAEVGATWDARRVRRRLRTHGVRRRLVVVDRPERGWEALTTSELQVARLVAEGLTNREVAERLFVSPHTVSGHLRHTFTKLGINSRVELAHLAVER